MSVRGAIFITAFILLSWTTSPSRVDAFDRFVGMSDKGSTQVKNCVDGVGGTESFANRTELNVALVIDLDGGDGLEGDDTFDAVFSYDGFAAPATVFNDVIVPATTPGGWVDSGIAIEAGKTLAVSATGSASPNGVDNFSPDGDGGPCDTCIAPLSNSRYALVGRIGVGGDPFLIGSSFSQTMFESGSLFLGFNDDFFDDNGGSFSVSGEISPVRRLVRGIWSKIDERNNVETYQLTPSGDLTNLLISGWWYLVLDFLSEEAGDACQEKPFSHISVAVSDIVKGILVVKKPIDVGSSKCDAACQDACGGANCREAEVSLDARAIMNNESATSDFSAKRDLVRFKYKAKGFVTLNP